MLFLYIIVTLAIHVDSCKLGVFQAASFAGDLHNSKRMSRGMFVHFCVIDVTSQFMDVQKQLAVGHCSTEAEIISPDAGPRMDLLPALMSWWECVFDVPSHSPPDWATSLH